MSFCPIRKTQNGANGKPYTAGPREQQPIVLDINTGRRFLVDTGAQVSVVPASSLDRRSEATKQQLQEEKGTPITTYRACNARLHFGNHRYAARLVIANVKRPLLGVDVLHQYNLLVDIYVCFL